jgi:transposase
LRIRALLREARVPDPEARPWSKAWLVWLPDAPRLGEQARWVISRCLADLARLRQEIYHVQQRLQQWATGDALIQRLLRCPGVGLVTAATLRAELGEFDRFRNGKQLARFIGLSPRNDSSGQRQQTGGLIKAGNGELRSLLVQLAHRLRRLDPRWRAWAQQLQARGKAGSLIAAALANRWTRWLHHEMTKPPGGTTPPPDSASPPDSAGPQDKTSPPRQPGRPRKTAHRRQARPAA